MVINVFVLLNILLDNSKYLQLLNNAIVFKKHASKI